MEFERFAWTRCRAGASSTPRAVATAGGSAALLAAMRGAAPARPRANRPPKATIAVLNAAIRHSRTLRSRPTTAGAPLLKGELVKVAAPRSSARRRSTPTRLSTAVTHPRRTIQSRPKASYDFPRVRTQRDVLLLRQHDRAPRPSRPTAEALPKLSSPDLRATAAAIVTNEAEHVSVLLGALGRPPGADCLRHGERVSMGTHNPDRLIIEDGDADTAAIAAFETTPARRGPPRPGHRRRRDRRGAGARAAVGARGLRRRPDRRVDPGLGDPAGEHRGRRIRNRRQERGAHAAVSGAPPRSSAARRPSTRRR